MCIFPLYLETLRRLVLGLCEVGLRRLIHIYRSTVTVVGVLSLKLLVLVVELLIIQLLGGLICCLILAVLLLFRWEKALLVTTTPAGIGVLGGLNLPVICV